MRTESRFDTDLARATVALILAGGNGTRLGELTRWQCKPAIPFAGSFRNIDFTLSNCVNSGVRRIAVLTQYKAQSLINHISGGWSFLARPLGEFVELWPAQQRLHNSWYVGTADAVHQNLDLLLAQRSRYTLVLAGDHVYKMDYRRLLEQHASTGADVTVACVPVPVEESAAFGVLGVDERQRVRSFIEKPPPSSLGLSGQRTVLASMGVEEDPECWVAWGDDPSIRYGILVPIHAGLVVCVVRVNVPGEGPRTTGKLVRWSRVQLGELAVETQAGHRIVTFQVEQYVLRGVDQQADVVGAFALALFAAVDGRPMPDLGGPRRRRPTRGKATARRALAKGGANAKGGRKAPASAGVPGAPAVPGAPGAAAAAIGPVRRLGSGEPFVSQGRPKPA